MWLAMCASVCETVTFRFELEWNGEKTHGKLLVFAACLRAAMSIFWRQTGKITKWWKFPFEFVDLRSHKSTIPTRKRVNWFMLWCAHWSPNGDYWHLSQVQVNMSRIKIDHNKYQFVNYSRRVWIYESIGLVHRRTCGWRTIHERLDTKRPGTNYLPRRGVCSVLFLCPLFLFLLHSNRLLFGGRREWKSNECQMNSINDGELYPVRAHRSNHEQFRWFMTLLTVVE